MLSQTILISWTPGYAVAPIYRYGYRVGHVERDEQGAGWRHLDYRARKLTRPVESLSPALIESIVEKFCAGLDGLQGALTRADVPVERYGAPKLWRA